LQLCRGRVSVRVSSRVRTSISFFYLWFKLKHHNTTTLLSCANGSVDSMLAIAVCKAVVYIPALAIFLFKILCFDKVLQIRVTDTDILGLVG